MKLLVSGNRTRNLVTSRDSWSAGDSSVIYSSRVSNATNETPLTGPVHVSRHVGTSGEPYIPCILPADRRDGMYLLPLVEDVLPACNGGVTWTEQGSSVKQILANVSAEFENCED